MVVRGLAWCAAAVMMLEGAPAWVAKSNEHAKVLLEATAKNSPEGAGNIGVDGLDEQITDFTERGNKAARQRSVQALAELRRRLKGESDPLVKQDLEIMIQAADRAIRSRDLEEKSMLPYSFISRQVFFGLRGLLDDQVKPERRKAALVRLRRYAGMEPGYQSIARLAEQRTRSKLNQKGLVGPYRGEVEEDLAQSESFLDGIGQLFAKYQITGADDALQTLRGQVASYNEFVRKEVLPRSRPDFRQPLAVYSLDLEQYGVDLPPADLVRMARGAFQDLQKQMQDVASRLAKEKGWSFTDYRQVIRELKREQITGEAILPHYRERLKQIEEIVRARKLVSLPSRDARIRIATAAETAASPAPNMRPPRLIGNTGEMGEFVLPLNVPGKGKESLQYDDFTFSAASWTLAAHELRPGHEMQFAKMVERGVSNARGIFAFNSTNVEGWGLYSEAILLPHMPLEGQLVSLQMRTLRAARAFLDPELQMGKVTVEEAKRVLEEDVVQSKAMAKQETDRYTFRAPGQATSYFYGYVKLMDLRREVESKLGPKFDAMRFHDFVLDQGLLPPALLRKAVLAEFVK